MEGIGRGLQDDWQSGEPLLCWGVLRARVDLLPQRKLVVDAAVGREVERDALDVVEHDVRDLQQSTSEV